MKTLWAARDKDGWLFICKGMPAKMEGKIIAGSSVVRIILDETMYPEVTFENSPKRLIVDEDK